MYKDKIDLKNRYLTKIKKNLELWVSKKRPPFYLQLIYILVVCTVTYLIASMIQSTKIGSPSMEPTLNTGSVYFISPYISNHDVGDIIYFEAPDGSGRTYAKRVIAKGGDSIRVEGPHVYLNGELLEEPYVSSLGADYYPETIVPDGQFFVLGDHRAISEDSRHWGLISEDKVKGGFVSNLWKN